MKAVKKTIINNFICAIMLAAPFFCYSQIDCSTVLQNLNFNFNADYNLKKTYEFRKTKYNLIDPNYASKHFGAFCKLENSSFRKSKIPIKFRLGNLQYVDALERKIPAYRLIPNENKPISN